MHIETCIQRIQQEGLRPNWIREPASPRGLTKEEIALVAPSNSPLPHELALWLPFDATWFSLLKSNTKELAFRPLTELLKEFSAPMPRDDDAPPDSGETLEEFDMVGAWLDLLPEAWLKDASVIELGCGGGSQEHFLTVNRKNEIKILGFHKRMEFWWKYESFGELVGHWFGFTKG